MPTALPLSPKPCRASTRHWRGCRAGRVGTASNPTNDRTHFRRDYSRFASQKVPAFPRRAALRKSWTISLVDSVNKANLIFLDPDNGIQGRRLTPKHVALAEIAALRRQDRELVTIQRQSGQKLEVRSNAERLKSIGCQSVEIVRFRLVSSQFYVIVDYDSALDARISSFARKWGDWVKIYYP